jgi:predicted ThiF/HesA family dinucleotide-utilizing enzyme
MRRRAWLGWLLTACASAAWADPSADERARIERLLDALAGRKDLRFVRNGKEYTAAQGADFLRGKLHWQIEKVATVQDFISQIGTRSTTSGDVYLVRLADGRTLPSAQFLAQELRRIEKR